MELLGKERDEEESTHDGCQDTQNKQDIHNERKLQSHMVERSLKIMD